MAFSSSMSVIQYYLLDRFPLPYGKILNTPPNHGEHQKLYSRGPRVIPTPTPVSAAAAYFIFLATLAAFTGQHIVRKLIMLLGRASLIIFVLSLTIFVSAISLGEYNSVYGVLRHLCV